MPTYSLLENPVKEILSIYPTNGGARITGYAARLIGSLKRCIPWDWDTRHTLTEGKSMIDDVLLATKNLTRSKCVPIGVWIVLYYQYVLDNYLRESSDH